MRSLLVPVRNRLVAALLVALAGLAALPAQAAIGDWVSGDVFAGRLVATIDQNGTLVGAVEIRLEPGWKTYWRTPGTGGLAPVFDFGRSWNVSGIVVGFPAPTRHDDGYSVTNIYEGTVLFPLTMHVDQPDLAGTLSLTLDLGVCDVVCIPVRFETTVPVSSAQIDPAALAIVDHARSLLPGAPHDGFAVTSVEVASVEGRLVNLIARATLPQAFGAELFIEPPTNWIPFVPSHVDIAGNEAVFHVTIERPTEETPITGIQLRLTAVSSGGAVEQWITLP